MRSKTIAAFALGFAAGLLSLSALLWTTGRLRTIHAAARTLPPIHVPGTLPDLSLVDRIPKPETTAIPSTDVPGQLAMPIQGLDAAKLRDSFRDARDGRQHDALDIPAPRGTPVRAVAEGNVAKLFTSKEGGLTVYQFDNTGAWCYYYAHLDHYAPGLSEGVLLRPGDVLGYVGTTGNAPPNAPHLHFAVFRLGPEKKWWQGQAVDPLPLLVKPQMNSDRR